MNPHTLPALALLATLGAGAPARAQDDPRNLMLQARALQVRGHGDDPKGAVALYRKVVALVPTSAQAQLRLSEAIQETGDIEGALEPAVKATELDPKSGEAWAHLALLRYYTANSGPAAQAQAVQALRKATRLLPNDPELWTRLAETLEVGQDEEGALQAWLAVGRLHPFPIYRGRVLYEYAFERAVELSVKLKQYEARREAALALVNKPNPEQRYLRILEELARDQVDAGFLGHAEESFDLLGQFLPQEPAIWENIALIQLRTARFDLALESLHKTEKLRPSPRVSYNTGMCLMRLGRLAEADARWKALLPAVTAPGAEDPALELPVKVLYSSCLLMEGRPKEVLELSQSWKETGTQSELAALRAQALIQTGQWKEARTVLKDGMQAFPKQDLFQKAALIPPKTFEEGAVFKSGSRDALSQLDLEAMAVLWSEFNCWDKCLTAVQSARKTAPVRNVDLLLLEANALETLGQDSKAMEVLREGQKLDPGNATLQNNLGYLLLEKGQASDVKEASQLIEAALAKEPGNSSTLDSWGWALFKQGRFTDAEEALRRASVMSPYSPEIHKHLGDTLLKLDRLQEALDEWERALAFVFPDRKDLEKQARELRTRVARSRRSAEEAKDPAPSDDPAGDDNEEDDL